MTVQELYDDRVKPLPAYERIRLASLILGDLAATTDGLKADVIDDWSDEDMADLSIASMRYAEQACPYEGDDDA